MLIDMLLQHIFLTP